MRLTCSESGRPTASQFSPPSRERYTPVPTDTLLRTHDSPVPTHTVFAFCGSIAIEPIESEGCLSKTGLNVVPPSTDFQTPPLAEPT